MMVFVDRALTEEQYPDENHPWFNAKKAACAEKYISIFYGNI